MPAWLLRLARSRNAFVFYAPKHRKQHSLISRLSTTLSHVFCLSYRDYAQTYNTDKKRWTMARTMSYCKAEKKHMRWERKEQRLGRNQQLTSFSEVANKFKSWSWILRHSHIFPLMRRASNDMSAKLFKFTKEEEKTNLKSHKGW
jgi:hypothetical protein